MREITIRLFYVFLVALFCPVSVSGQGPDEPDLEKLRRQVAELQGRLNVAAGQGASKNLFSDNERVRSVGRQIVSRKKPQEEELEIALQIRLYDLSDLFAVSPSYPAERPNELEGGSRLFANSPANHVGSGGGGLGGSVGGGGGGVFRLAPNSPKSAGEANHNLRAAQVTLDQLVQTIKETVKPEMWGGDSTSARIKFLGNTLLVTATEDMHSQINNLLNLFREHWGKRRTISVQTYWIRADHGEAFGLIDQETTEKSGAGVVKPERWKAFFTKVRDEKKIAYAATLTGQNNQTLHALSGKQVRLTVDAEPFETANFDWQVKSFDEVDDNPFGDDDDDLPTSSALGLIKRNREVVGFRPIETLFHEGAAIQITPMATRGGNFVILDLQAKINELIKQPEPGDTIFVEGSKKRVEVQLDNTDYVSCRFNSTLRCPDDQVVLAGSMSWDPSSEHENPEVYLFVRASIHTIEEDQSDWKKTTVVDPKKAGSKPENKK